MRTRVARSLPALLLVVTVLAELVAVVLSWGLEPAYDTLLYAVSSTVFAGTGAVILRRHPRHLIGWLLLGNGVFNALASDLAQGYGLRAAAEGWPAGTVAELIFTASWLPGAPAFALIALLFPNDRLPNRRWWLVVWAGVAGAAVGTVGWMLSPAAGGSFVSGTNPYAVSALPTRAIFIAGFTVAISVLCAAFVNVGLRFRRSAGIERQQMKLFALSTGLLLVVLPAAGLFLLDSPLLAMATTVAVTLWPLSIGAAVLRYRLYDIDVVINKAVVFGTLAFFISAVYVAIVVGVGRLAGGGDRPNLALSVVATAVVAVAFQPVREWVQRFANRLVYGQRATPYEVLSEFADRVGGSYDAGDLLPTMARTVAEGVGAERVEVWLATGPGLVRETSWPSQDSGAPGAAKELRELVGDRVVEVRHQGELLGALSVVKPTGEQLTPGEEKLLDDVAAQAGLVLRNVRLIEDLRSSRQRLVTTADEERRRLERNLHDGAQQSLVSVALMINAARARLSPSGEGVGPALEQVAEQLTAAIDELRELARGIHPAVLTERGLGPALRSLAERSPVPVVVEYDVARRPPAAVEASLYFVVAEALTNIAKYAHATEATVTVSQAGGLLTVVVVDDGIGGADESKGSGLRGLVDRVAVVDGSLTVSSPPGRGTTLTCAVPSGGRTDDQAVPDAAADDVVLEAAR